MYGRVTESIWSLMAATVCSLAFMMRNVTRARTTHDVCCTVRNGHQGETPETGDPLPLRCGSRPVLRLPHCKDGRQEVILQQTRLKSHAGDEICRVFYENVLRSLGSRDCRKPNDTNIVG